MFYGNFDVCIKALTYVLSLGREGIPEAAKNAVLNANYMMACLKDKFDMAYDQTCMHEFVMTLESSTRRRAFRRWTLQRECWTLTCIRPQCTSR